MTADGTVAENIVSLVSWYAIFTDVARIGAVSYMLYHNVLL